METTVVSGHYSIGKGHVAFQYSSVHHVTTQLKIPEKNAPEIIKEKLVPLGRNPLSKACYIIAFKEAFAKQHCALKC